MVRFDRRLAGATALDAATLDRLAPAYDLLVFGRPPDHQTHVLRDFA